MINYIFQIQFSNDYSKNIYFYKRFAYSNEYNYMKNI